MSRNIKCYFCKGLIHKYDPTYSIIRSKLDEIDSGKYSIIFARPYSEDIVKIFHSSCFQLIAGNEYVAKEDKAR